MTFYPMEQDRINRIIASGAKGQMQLDEFIKLRTDEWLSSDKRNMMLVGEQYYLNHTAIQKKKVELENRSNIKLEHAFVRKLVDQKIGYLLSKQPSIKSNNNTYTDLLNTIFNKSFLRVLKNVGKDAINKGIAWLQIYFNPH